MFMTKIDEIHVVFENVERIEVPYSDVRYFHLGEIFESIWDNNILYDKDFELKPSKRAKYLELIMKDKHEYTRIKEHLDITHIKLLSEGKTIEYINIQWEESSNDDFNKGQKNTYKKNEIHISAGQEPLEVEEK